MEVKITGLEKIVDMLEALNTKVENLRQPAVDYWLDNDEFVELLKISRKTAQHYRDNGLIEFSQISAKIYYKHSDVNKFLESHKIKRFVNNNKTK